jgi:Domain of unknown function (DUF5134)
VRPVLAALMLVIAGGSAVRLGLAFRRGAGAELDADGLHLVMGVAMAGMLEPELGVLPSVVWRVTFAAAAGWFGWRTLRARLGRSQHPMACAWPVPHFIECLAMLYMLGPTSSLAAGKPGSRMTMPGMGGSGLSGLGPVIPLLLVLSMAGYIIWTAERATARTGSAASSDRQLTSRVAVFFKIAMSVTMGYMLLT